MIYNVKEKTYVVTVLRIGYAHQIIKVFAMSEKQAREKAEDVAGNYNFSEHSSEYEIQEIREEKKEK